MTVEEKRTMAKEWMDKRIDLWHKFHEDIDLCFDEYDTLFDRPKVFATVCGADKNDKHEIHISMGIDDRISGINFAEFARLLGINTITYDPNRYKEYGHTLVSFEYKDFIIFTLLDQKKED